MIKILHGVIASSNRVTPTPPLFESWDITTLAPAGGSPVEQIDIYQIQSDPDGIAISADGTKVYIIGSGIGGTPRGGESVQQLNLSIPYDLTTADIGSPPDSIGSPPVYDTFDLTDYSGSTSAVTFSPDGTKMFCGGSKIYRFDLSVAWDITTAAPPTGSPNLFDNVHTTDWIQFSPDGTKMYLNERSNSLVTYYELGVAWDVSTASLGSPEITFDTSGKQTFCTDMYLKPDGTTFWVTGNVTQYITQATFGTPFDLSTAAFGSPLIESDTAVASITTTFTMSDDGNHLYVKAGGSGSHRIEHYTMN